MENVLMVSLRFYESNSPNTIAADSGEKSIAGHPFTAGNKIRRYASTLEIFID